MNNDGQSAALTAVLRTIAEKRKIDPLIGAKLGSKEVFQRLLAGLKNERGVRVETLLCALGALAGYACQASARAKVPGGLTTITGADGNRYFFGDAINKPLLEDNYSVWGIAAAAAQDAGSASLPDVEEIVRHVAQTVGGPQFGIPRVPDSNKPGELPTGFVKALWPSFQPLLRQFTIDAKEWPILFALSVREAIVAGKNAIDPGLALKLAMEAAIAASKFDMMGAMARKPSAASPEKSAPMTRPAVPSAATRPSVAPSPARTATTQKKVSAPSKQDEAEPELWNPNAAALWSLLFSPIFGAWLHAKNWKALGDDQKAMMSMLVVAIGFILIGIAAFVQPTWIKGAGGGYLVAWYVVLGRQQIDQVKERFGNDYPRRGWLLPLGIAGGIAVTSVIVATSTPPQTKESREIRELAKKLEGIARDVESAQAKNRNSNRSAIPPHQNCPFLRYKSPAATAPQMPADAAAYYLDARKRVISQAKSASFQDAVFFIHHYNFRRYGPSSTQLPDIEPVEVFATAVNESEYKERLCRASAAMTVTAYVGAAAQGYKDATSLEEAMARLRREHPGFSEEVYKIVQYDSMVAMR